jgi:hypothetical protein
MDSSDGAQKQVQMTVRKKKKRQPALIDSAMYQALVDQLDNTHLKLSGIKIARLPSSIRL